MSAARSRKWQDEVWDLLNEVGEFGWYVRWRARGCSRARLIASEIDPDTGEITGTIRDDDPQGKYFANMVRQIAGGPLGQTQFVRRTAEVLSVPGELYHTILVTPQGEKWVPATKDEITQSTKANTVLVTLPDGTKHEFNRDNGDGMYRVWESDTRRANEPTSAARANLDSLREIQRTTRKIKNADLSRLISAGAFLIPQEASLPGSVAPTSADKPGADGEQPLPAILQGAKAAESVQQAFVRVAKTAVEEGEGSLAATVPIVIAMPGEHINAVKRVMFSDEVTATAIMTRNDAIARLAKGLDMAPEQLLGLGSNSNHWNAFMLQDEDVQLHISPVMELICQAIYDNVLSGMLVAAGIDPTRYTLWFDTSVLTADPDLTDEAKDAHEKGAASSKYLLKAYRLPEDAGYDLTTIEGYQELARDKLTAAKPGEFAQLLHDVMPLLDAKVQAINFPDPAALPPADDHGDDHGDDDEDKAQDRDEEPDTEGDQDKTESASLSEPAAMALAERMLVSRAFELAGKRRRTRSDMARLAAVPIARTHRFMPPVDESEIPRLISGWDAALEDDTIARLGLDTEALRTSALRIIRRELTSPVVDA